MARPMIDIAELEARLKKAQSRAFKAKSAFDVATAEAARLETALSVVREMMGPSVAVPQGAANLTSRQQVVVNSLKFGSNNAMSPVEVFAVAAGNSSFEGDVNYVRTTLWRMADKGVIGNSSGAYWRFPVDEAVSVESAILDAQNSSVVRSPEVPDTSLWDDDSEIPF